MAKTLTEVQKQMAIKYFGYGWYDKQVAISVNAGLDAIVKFRNSLKLKKHTYLDGQWSKMSRDIKRKQGLQGTYSPVILPYRSI